MRRGARAAPPSGRGAPSGRPGLKVFRPRDDEASRGSLSTRPPVNRRDAERAQGELTVPKAVVPERRIQLKTLSIRLRILMGMMAVIFGFLVLTSVAMDSLVDRFFQHEVSNVLERGRQSYDHFTKVRDEMLLDKARSVAQATQLKTMLARPTVDRRTLEYLLLTYGETATAPLLVVTDADGLVVADNLSREGRPAVVRGEPGAGSVLAGSEYSGAWEYAGRVYHVAAAPVVITKRVAGILAMGYPLDDRAAKDLSKISGQDVTIAHRGRFLAAAWDTEVRAEESAASLLSPAEAESWLGLRPFEPTRVSGGGEPYLVTAVPQADGETVVFLGRPLDRALAEFRSTKEKIYLFALAVFVLALLVSQLIAARISQPIRELGAASNALARGHLGAQVGVSSDDEIGVLGRSFNAMARRIESLIERAMEKAKAAEEANHAKSVFLATMSHELRTPLNGVLGSTEALLGDDGDPGRQELAQVAHRSAEELLTMINAILEYSQLEFGKERLEEQDFNLQTAVRRTTDKFQQKIDAKKLDFSVVIEADVPESVTGSVLHFRQILANLLDNAIKFTSEGTLTVHVATLALDEESVTVRVSVKDTGIGIPEEALGSIFEPFAQLDSTTTRAFGGAGLGLALCRDFARMLGGDVGVHSRPQAGSTFWFTARLALTRADVREEKAARLARWLRGPEPPPALPSPSRNPTAPAEWRRGQRILVVDDNRVNQRMVGLVLGKAGWDYEVSENGADAVERIREKPFDLVLMDCRMPVMDGFEATRMIRDSEQGTGRHVPIVAVTANTSNEDRLACSECGMDDFLGKPVRSAQLVRVLDTWLAPTGSTV